jgi:hypothetical protein
MVQNRIERLSILLDAIAGDRKPESSSIKFIRARRERPGGRAAEERDELAPFHQQFLPCFEAEDSTAGDLLHCGISKESLSAVGHERRSDRRWRPADVRFRQRPDLKCQAGGPRKFPAGD